MFFDRGKDPFEVNNQINNPEYADVIPKMRGYYTEYVKNTPATGKNEWVREGRKRKG
jgi:hypothetical protein